MSNNNKIKNALNENNFKRSAYGDHFVNDKGREISFGVSHTDNRSTKLTNPTVESTVRFIKK